jgi:hypothetical protein
MADLKTETNALNPIHVVDQGQPMKQVIETNKQKLVDEVEAEVSPEILVNELVRRYPMSHGQIDKAHGIWARALRDVLWLGWLSEAKKRRGVYDQAACDAIRQSLIDAFETGVQYADQRP